MIHKSIGYLALVCAILLIICAASAETFKSSPTIDRDSVIDKVSGNQYSSPIYAKYKEYSQSYTATRPINVSISLVINSYDDEYYSTYGSEWPYQYHYPTYRFHYDYPYSGMVYYPGQYQSATRGYGGLIVYGPDDGNTYYLWIKSKFFATDVNPNYDMRWHYGGIIPVSYEDILAGTYCLKTTTAYDVNAAAIWCGTAVVADNMTTTVRACSVCPFGCTCC